ncbi:MAG: glycoside hydrolase family 5 protein [Reyranellaceae bacterium]
MIRLVLSLVLIALALPAWAADPPSGFVRVEGKRFVAPDGRTLQLKGINLGNWLMPEGYMFKFERAKSPRQIEGAIERMVGAEAAQRFWRTYRETYITEDDLAFIKSVGFNLVRIPLHYRHFVRGDRFEGEGYALLDRAIGWARAHGLYVVLDIHAAPGGQTGINHDDGPGYPLMFYVQAHRRLTIALWRHIAERYRDEPAILGYDLLNEPIAPYHDVAWLNPKLEPFYREVTAAIRSVDPQRIIFLAGGQWSSTFDMFGPPWTGNLAFTFHSFWASTRRDSIQRHLTFSARYDVPLFIGETGELTDEWNEGFRTLLERHGIGWSFWTYKNLDTPSTVVSIPRPADWNHVIAVADRPRARWADPLPVSRERLYDALGQYLEGARFANGTIRWSYLKSLGLKSQP